MSVQRIAFAVIGAFMPSEAFPLLIHHGHVSWNADVYYKLACSQERQVSTSVPLFRDGSPTSHALRDSRANIGAQ